jgi:MFS family permease
MLVTVSLMPMIYGAISDNYGLRLSFLLALGILLLSALLTTFFLPRRPEPG